MRSAEDMQRLQAWLGMHQGVVRVALVLALLVLAACTPNNGDGGAPGY